MRRKLGRRGSERRRREEGVREVRREERVGRRVLLLQKVVYDFVDERVLCFRLN